LEVRDNGIPMALSIERSLSGQRPPTFLKAALFSFAPSSFILIVTKLTPEVHMKNTDSHPVSGKGPLSTLRGKITAAILVLLTMNTVGVGWLMLTAWSALPLMSWSIAAILLLAAFVFGAVALKFLNREASKGISEINAVFRNIQSEDADLSCNMETLDNPDLQHISSCYNTFLGSVRELVDFYKVTPEEIIVIYDDISLDVGQLRIRKKGSAGGHNGIKSIISHLGTDEFPRIKVGVGDKPKDWDLADYVLSRFQGEEQATIREALKDTSDACKMIATGNIDAAMNHYNRKK